MAATSCDSAEQDSPSSSNENGSPLSGETEDELRGLQLPELKQSDEEQLEEGGEGKAVRKAAAAEEEDEEEEIGSVSAGGEEETSEQQSPASSSETGDCPEKELKQEQSGEFESGDCNQKSKAAEDTLDKGNTTGGVVSEHANKRRASVEMSSSDGEPLSRMDSEDSISSTLMDMDSTASSGRSTPAMMNGQGSTTPSTKSIAYNCCWDQCQTCFNSSPDLAEHIRSFHVDGQRGGVFVCLWKGCKVYNTPSTSHSWLQRHMLTHSGDKPFKFNRDALTEVFFAKQSESSEDSHEEDCSSASLPSTLLKTTVTEAVASSSNAQKYKGKIGSYNFKWEMKYPWLVYRDGKMYCV